MQDMYSTTEKNGHASRAVLMAMRIRRYDAERITQYGRSRATLDATGCRHWASKFTPYRLGGRHFSVKNGFVALWKSLSKASVQKARNGPSTQLVKATSCVERSNATMKAEELS